MKNLVVHYERDFPTLPQIVGKTDETVIAVSAEVIWVYHQSGKLFKRSLNEEDEDGVEWNVIDANPEVPSNVRPVRLLDRYDGTLALALSDGHLVSVDCINRSVQHGMNNSSFVKR